MPKARAAKKWPNSCKMINKDRPKSTCPIIIITPIYRLFLFTNLINFCLLKTMPQIYFAYRPGYNHPNCRRCDTKPDTMCLQSLHSSVENQFGHLKKHPQP